MALAAPFVAAYVVGLVLILSFEFVAIVEPRRGDTLSELVWAVRTTPFVWALLPALSWVFLHWSLPFEPDRSAVNDLGYVAVGVGFAVWNLRHQAARRRRA